MNNMHNMQTGLTRGKHLATGEGGGVGRGRGDLEVAGEREGGGGDVVSVCTGRKHVLPACTGDKLYHKTVRGDLLGHVC